MRGGCGGGHFVTEGLEVESQPYACCFALALIYKLEKYQF